MDDTFRKAMAHKIGRRLRTARTTRGFSQHDLAMHSGVILKRLKRYEAGASSMSVDELEKVAATLRLPVSHFVEACAFCSGE